MPSGKSIRLVDVPLASNVSSGDTVFVNSNNAVSQCPIGSVFANVSADITASTLILQDINTPSSPNDLSVVGKIFFDQNYLYVTVANNTIKRIPLNFF